MSPPQEGTCTVSHDVPSGLTVPIMTLTHNCIGIRMYLKYMICAYLGSLLLQSMSWNGSWPVEFPLAPILCRDGYCLQEEKQITWNSILGTHSHLLPIYSAFNVAAPLPSHIIKDVSEQANTNSHIQTSAPVTLPRRHPRADTSNLLHYRKSSM